MKAIVAVDSNWGIGCQDKLLVRIPEDMKYFKEMTIGKVVVMGRTTFESFPGQEPLKDRVNIILTKNKEYTAKGAVVCCSIDDLLDEIKKYNMDDVFVIGGESIYKQLLPYCTEAYVTKIDNSYPADKYFVNIDEEQSWQLVSKSETKSWNDIRFCFTKYQKA